MGLGHLKFIVTKIHNVPAAEPKRYAAVLLDRPDVEGDTDIGVTPHWLMQETGRPPA